MPSTPRRPSAVTFTPLGLKQSREKLARFQNLLHVNGPWHHLVETHTQSLDRVREQLQKERAAVTRFWKEREAIYDALLTSTREIDALVGGLAKGQATGHDDKRG